jgi:hypothetical protein
VVLNDGLHEQCCCRMVTRLRHLSPICPPCMRRSGTDFVVDDVSQQLRTQDSRLGLSQGETSRGGGERGGDWDTVLCLALRMAVRAGFVHVSFRGLENARGQTRNLELGSVEALEMGWTLGALPLN